MYPPAIGPALGFVYDSGVHTATPRKEAVTQMITPPGRFRAIVIGSRFRPAIDVKTVLDRYDGVITEIITGGSTGADAAARAWATDHNVTCKVLEPDWIKDGDQAIIRRNTRLVADGAELCLAFPMHESTGTKDLIHKAVQAGVPTTTVASPEEIKRTTHPRTVSVMPQDGELISMTSKHMAVKYRNALEDLSTL